MENIIQRPRRNRKNQVIRDLVQETELSVKDLIYPMFLVDGKKKSIPIQSMPGISRFSSDNLLREMEQCMKLGIKTFALFPNLEEKYKDKTASEGLNKKGLYLRTIREIKKNLPEAVLMSDVAMDPYSSDGHDGYVKNGEILNDITLERLGKMAVAQAEAVVD